MTNPDVRWVAIAPGVMELPHTKMQIRYEAGSSVPFRVTYDGLPIPDGIHCRLAAAQYAGEVHMAELIIMGFES